MRQCHFSCFCATFSASDFPFHLYLKRIFINSTNVLLRLFSIFTPPLIFVCVCVLSFRFVVILCQNIPICINVCVSLLACAFYYLLTRSYPVMASCVPALWHRASFIFVQPLAAAKTESEYPLKCHYCVLSSLLLSPECVCQQQQHNLSLEFIELEAKKGYALTLHWRLLIWTLI